MFQVPYVCSLLILASMRAPSSAARLRSGNVPIFEFALHQVLNATRNRWGPIGSLAVSRSYAEAARLSARSLLHHLSPSLSGSMPLLYASLTSMVSLLASCVLAHCACHASASKRSHWSTSRHSRGQKVPRGGLLLPFPGVHNGVRPIWIDGSPEL